MLLAPLPYLLYIGTGLEKLDRLGWTAGMSFSAYGIRFGLQVNDPAALEQLRGYLPLGWEPIQTGEVDVLYSLWVAPPGQGQRDYYLLYVGPELLARTLDLHQLGQGLEQHAQLLTAFLARDCLFVHAGVVGWQGRAIVIPGRSMAGKTTLVNALVEAGATYYSDEFAILDRQGHVHPYPLPLSIRGEHGQPARRWRVGELGGQAGVAPIPVRLVVITTYQPGATWRPRRLSPGQALLALMDNAVAARRNPAYSMPILKHSLSGAAAFGGKRGEAEAIVADVLRRVALDPQGFGR
jgi:hypothetical protein